MEIDLDRYATVLKVVLGGEEEIAEGTVRAILEDFAEGNIGRPGGLFMRLEGLENVILGRQLMALVERYRLGSF
jgi:hypothetical protein